MSEIADHREQYELAMRRRLRAVDNGLSAMLVVITKELADDPRGVEIMREIVANLRNKFIARYPFASDVMGTPTQ